MAEMLLEFYVKDQTLVRKKDGQIPRKDSEGYLFLKFNFIGQTWGNLDIIPWIGYQDENKQAWSVKSDTAVDLNRYQVPVGYLGQDYFLVSLSGTNSDGIEISTNVVKVPLAEASSEIVNLPNLPEDAGGQSIIDLVSKAVSAAEAANAVVKSSGYVDVTEAYRADDEYRDQPEEYLRSLGVGKWTLDDDWAIYSIYCWEVSGTVWLDESYSTDDGFYNRTLSANGQEVVYLDSGDGVLRINGKPLSGATELDWAEMDAIIGDAIGSGGGGSPEGGGSAAGGVTEARMQEYVTERLKEYVTETAMKDYVKKYVDSTLAAIPIAEERSYG